MTSAAGAREDSGQPGMAVAITGASRGIGRQTALLLAEEGCWLLLGARDAEALGQLADEIRQRHPACRVEVRKLDVTQPAEVAAFAELGQERFGQIDGLVNSAGFGVFQDALELAVEDFSRMIDVNLKGTFLSCQAFGKGMKSRGRGRILNLASVAGVTALPGCSGYSASKFGVMGLTRVLQAELRRFGVQVTAVVPGSVRSSFWDGMASTPDKQDMIPVEVLAAHLVYLLKQPPGAFIDEIAIMPPKGIL